MDTGGGVGVASVVDPREPALPDPRRWARGRVRAFHFRDRTRHRIDRPAGDANPYEAWVFAVCVLSGAATLTRLAQPSSLDALVAPWLRVAWAGLMTVGGVFALLGLYWPGSPLTGVYVKRAGILAQTGALLAYGLALLAIGRPGVVVALVMLGLAGAGIVRTRQITRAAAAFADQLRQLERFSNGADGRAGNGADG